MFPLVSILDEVRRAKVLVREAKAELVADGVEFDDRIEIGAMIEVLSAHCHQIADEDFSARQQRPDPVTMTVDRVNERVAGLLPAGTSRHHPALGDHRCRANGKESGGDPRRSRETPLILLLIGLGWTNSAPARSSPQ
jgi:hypothetical protein